MDRIPVSGPWITDKEVEYVADAARNAWYGNANMYHQRFQQAFAGYLGVARAIALPSCTSAIHLALAGLGIGPGDEVIVPDATWIATAAPIAYVGATPVFADIDRRSWCLSPQSFESCVTNRTKAVITVDLYGNVPDMDPIRAIAGSRGIAIIEDAAEAIGATYKGAKAGVLGDVGVFSFHGSKTLTTGEGGMLVSDDRDLIQRVEVLRDHGRRPGDKMFWNHEIGFKYKMSSLQAALGLAQLERVEELVDRKRRIFGWYREALADVEGVSTNWEAPNTASTYWMVTVVPDASRGAEKETIIGGLAARGIDSRPFFYPLSSLPAYTGHAEATAGQERNVVSYDVGKRGVNLPSGLNLTEEDVGLVVQGLREVLGAAKPASRAARAQAAS